VRAANLSYPFNAGRHRAFLLPYFRRGEGTLLGPNVSVEVELKMAAKILLALIVGGFMGWDRKHLRPAAGIRTYAAVCLASCLFGSLSLNMSEQSERARIAAQVVSGIGFLGAGVIIRDQGKIAGLTTAASIWAAAAVGLAVAFDMYLLAVITAILLFMLLEMHQRRNWEGTSANDAPHEPENEGNPKNRLS